jgi:hypothetical protein
VSALRQEVFQVLRSVTLCGPHDDRTSHAHDQANKARAPLSFGWGRGGDNLLNLGGRRFRGRFGSLANRPALARNQQETRRNGRPKTHPWVTPHVITPVSGRFRAGDHATHVLMQVNTDLRHPAPNLVDLTGRGEHGALPCPRRIVPYCHELHWALSGYCKQRARSSPAPQAQNSLQVRAGSAMRRTRTPVPADAHPKVQLYER